MQFLITDQIMEAPESYAGGWHMRNGQITGVIRAKYGLPEAEKGRQEISWDDALEEICEDASKNSFLDVSERKRVIRLLRPHLSENRKSLICDFGASSGHMIADLQDCFSWNRFVACDLCGGGVTAVLQEPAGYHAHTDEPEKDTVSGSGGGCSGMSERTGTYRK